MVSNKDLPTSSWIPLQSRVSNQPHIVPLLLQEQPNEERNETDRGSETTHNTLNYIYLRNDNLTQTILIKPMGVTLS
jgi:hypothetical protein